MRAHFRTFCVAFICLAACVIVFAMGPALSAPAPVTWLIFVDDLHLEFRNTGRIRTAMKTLAAELIQEGDSFSLVSSGPSNMTVDLSTNREVLEAEVKKAIGSGLRYEDIVQGPNGASEARYRASRALAIAQSMLTNLSRMPAGRKSLLYITSGYSFDVLPEPMPASRTLGNGLDVSRSEVRQQLNELTATAARSAVTIYAIDPRTAFKGPIRDLPPSAHQAAMHSVMRSMSEGTGGFAIVQGDFLSQLKRIADATRK